MSKKGIILPTAVLASSFLFASLASAAEIPANSVILGEKGYALQLLDKTEYFGELQGAVANANGILVWNTAGGELRSIVNMSEVDKSIIPPQLTYKDAKGEESVIVVDEEEQELKVESVSAIDTKKVVTIKATVPEAEEGATANVAIFAVDEEDERTAVANKDVEIEDGVVEVDFDIDTGNYVVVVTFEEETAEKPFAIDFEAANDAVDAVNNADTQIKLAKALENEYFVEYYVEENIVAYQPIVKESNYVTVDEIVEDLKDINKEEAAKGEFATVKAALEAAKGNQLTIIRVLNDNFEDVNSDYIIGYNGKIFDDMVVKSHIEDMKAIQSAIYDVNEKEAEAAYDKAFKSLKAEDVAAARVAAGYLEDAEVATDAGITKQEFANDHLDVLDALIAVHDAETDSALKSALVALDKLDTDLVKKYEDINVDGFSAFATEDFKIDSVLDDQLANYRDAIGEAYADERNQRSDIQNIIDEVNKEVHSIYDFDFTLPTNIIADEEYKIPVTFKAVKEYGKGYENVRFKVDVPEADVDKVSLKATDTSNDEYDMVETGYWGPPSGFNIPEDYEADTEVTAKFAEAGTYKITFSLVDSEDEIIADTTETVTVTVEKAYVVRINEATTAEEMRTALTALALAEGIADYINLSSQGKLEVAELVLAARADKPNEEFAGKTDVTTAVGGSSSGAIQARQNLINGVNGANDIATMNEKLGDLEYKAFDDLTALEKVEVAEAFLNAFPEDEDGNRINYTTLTAIKADLDAAIAK